MLTSYQRHRLLLLIAVVVGFGLFWVVGDFFHIPVFAGQETSLFQMPSVGNTWLIVAGTLFVATAVCSAIVGRVRFEAGLFAAVLGLSALSMRSGPMGQTLRTAANAATSAGAGQSQSSAAAAPAPTIYLTLAGELALLYALVGIAWGAVWWLHRGERLPKWMPRLRADEFREGVEGDAHSLTDKLTAFAIALLVTGLLVMLFARSDEKAQALIGVFISSFVGTMVAYSLYPVTPSAWYWAAPLVVGLVGYISGWQGADAGWRVGQPQWLLAPLARPAPLDYASFGPAGAILGYWISRGMHRTRQEEELAAVEEAAA